MTCLDPGRFVDLLDRGGLDAADAEERAHLSSCSACREEWGSVAGASDFLQGRRAAAPPARSNRWIPLAAAAALLLGILAWTVLPPADPATPTTAAARPQDPEELARWLKDLESDDIRVRDEAENRIVALGLPAIEPVREARRRSEAALHPVLDRVLARLAAARFGSVACTALMEEAQPGVPPPGESCGVAVVENGACKILGTGHSPAWSPDGTRIAFVSARGGNPDVYTMKADGSDVVQVTKNRSNDLMPRWSPDGRRLVFASDRDGNYEIYTAAADGSELRALTSNAESDYAPDWSPDGKSIAFVSQRDGNDEIYAMDSDGGNPRRLTRCPVIDTAPRWSPDGRKLLFLSGRHLEESQGVNISMLAYVMDADGRNSDRVTRDVDLDLYSAGWSADGSRIVYASAEGGEAQRLQHVDLAGDGRVTIAGSPTIDEGSFTVTGPTRFRLQCLTDWRGSPSLVIRAR